MNVGDRYPTNNNGDVEVLAYRSADDVDVIFIDTGHVKESARKHRILSGAVRDPTAKPKTGIRTENSFLKVIERLGRKTDYLCRLCGKIKTSKTYGESDIPISCGCIASLLPNKDYTGQEIKGVRFIGYKGSGEWKVKFPCGCYRFTTHYLVVNRVNNSCGDCREYISPTTRHGLNKSPTHNSWQTMKRRCNDVNNNRFEHYGLRGITYCKEWESFDNFLKDMGIRPEGCTLERKDLNKGYNKENCKWASDVEQANNKTNNILISNGEKVMSLKYWCDVEGIGYKNAHYRFKYKGECVSSILGSKYKLVSNKQEI